mgnify:FL=1|jgi:hypothetical protein
MRTNRADVLAAGYSTSTPYNATRVHPMGKPKSPLIKAKNGEADHQELRYMKVCLGRCSFSTRTWTTLGQSILQRKKGRGVSRWDKQEEP